MGVGEFDGGIELDGGSYVDIPWSDSIDVGEESFSTEIWFKYSEKVAHGSLIWGYKVGGGKPQFWIRTEPKDNRIRGLIHDRVSPIIVKTQEPHNDGNWHHLAFVRDKKTRYSDHLHRRSGGRLPKWQKNKAPPQRDRNLASIWDSELMGRTNSKVSSTNTVCGQGL